MFLASLPGSSFAQSLAPQVIGTAGAYYTSAGGSLAWTIGEVVVETDHSASNYLTQGFHQTGAGFITSVQERGNPFGDIRVYPNPSENDLYFDMRDAGNAHYAFDLYDISGQKLRSVTSEQVNVPGNICHISMAGYSAGIYLVNVINLDKNQMKSFRITKSN